MCDCITNHQYGGPGKTALDSESDGNSHIACSSLCRLPPRPTRVVLLTGRKPSLLEAEGSASKDAETSAEEAALTVLRMLYAEQAQYHGHAVDTRRQLREVSTFNSTLSFKILGFNRQGTLSVGRNRSERSGFGTVLRRWPVHPRTETVSERGVSERTFQKSVSVPTAQSESEGTPESADACWRPRGKNNTGTPYTVEDRGTGGLASPAVHHTESVGLPVPERCGSPPVGL